MVQNFLQWGMGSREGLEDVLRHQGGCLEAADAVLRQLDVTPSSPLLALREGLAEIRCPCEKWRAFGDAVEKR